MHHTSFDTAPDDIRSQLAPGEQVLWQGRPGQGIMLRACDSFLIPFSLLWCAIAVRNTQAAWSPALPVGFRMLSGFFIVFGLYFLVGRFIVDAFARAHTRYALTRERVLIVSGASTRTVKSLPLKTLGEINLSRQASGEGTIVFGHDVAFPRPAGMEWMPGSQAALAPRFERIPDAEAVYALIRDAQRELLRA